MPRVGHVARQGHRPPRSHRGRPVGCRPGLSRPSPAASVAPERKSPCPVPYAILHESRSPTEGRSSLSRNRPSCWSVLVASARTGRGASCSPPRLLVRIPDEDLLDLAPDWFRKPARNQRNCGHLILGHEAAADAEYLLLQGENRRDTASNADCHAEGRGFESLQPLYESPANAGFFGGVARAVGTVIEQNWAVALIRALNDPTGPRFIGGSRPLMFRAVRAPSCGCSQPSRLGLRRDRRVLADGSSSVTTWSRTRAWSPSHSSRRVSFRATASLAKGKLAPAPSECWIVAEALAHRWSSGRSKR